MMLVAYFDRINLSVAGPTIMAALHMSKTQFGLALSAFTLGYALMQIPGGYLADKFGSKPLLVTALVIWSAFTALTGMVTSLLSLQIVRVLFGVGEGIENGAQFKLVGDNFTSGERSQANALFLTALALGPAIGTPLTTSLLARFGWRELFFWFAGIGLAVAALLALLLPKDKGEAHAPSTPAPVKLRPPRRLKSVWLCAFSYLLFNMAFWGFLSWVPTYLTSERHVTLSKMGLLGAVPYLCGLAGMLLFGRLGSMPRVSGGKALGLGFGLLGAAAFLLDAPKVQSVAACVFCLSGAAFFLFAFFGPFWSIAIDLAPGHRRGAFTGFINFMGQIGGFTAQIVIGLLADTMKSFVGAFLFMSAALLVGFACLARLSAAMPELLAADETLG